MQPSYKADVVASLDAGTVATDDRAQIYYATAVDEVNAATADADQVMSDLIASVADELNGATANLNSLADELIGATDVILTDTGTQLAKVVVAIGKDVSKQLGSAFDALNSAGFEPPYQTSDMEAAVSGDFMVMVAQAVPPFRPYLGVEPTLYASEVPRDTTPSYSTALGYDAPGQVVNQGALGAGDLFAINPPDGTSPPATTVSGPTPAGQPGGVCCPAPVNVTINVPPIAVMAPGSTAPGSSTALTVNVPGSTGGTPQYPTNGKPPAAPPGGTSFDVSVRAGATATGPSFAGSTPSSLLFPLNPLDLKATNEYAVPWGQIIGCERIEEIMEREKGVTAAVPLPNLSDPLKSFVDSVYGQQVGTHLFGLPGGIGDKMKDLAKVFITSETLMAQSALAAVNELASTAVLGSFAPQNVPNPVTATFFASKMGIAQKVENNTGIPATYLAQGDMYGLQYSNPQYLPNQIRVDDAFLSGQINENTWICWTRANGNLQEPARRVMAGNQRKPNLMDLITLYRRGNLSKEDLPKRARELGVIEPAYLPEWLAITTALPTQSDLISFMVRDAADERVAKKYQYDKDFELKFSAQMKKWADALGLDEQYFRFMWRTHWRIPSYTQLTEMYARLRPDRPEIKEYEAEWEGFPLGAVPVGKPPKPPSVTIADVKEALEIDDMAPGWVDRLIAVSTNPINRTDAVRAYQIGAFDEERLYHAFRDVRYSDRDAKTLVEFYKQDRARRRSNITGTWSIRKITKYFKAGYLSRDQATNLMRPLTASLKEVEQTLQAAEDEVTADTRASAVRGVRRGYFAGEHSSNEALNLLIKFGVDKIVADRLITSWTIDRDTRYKRLSATQTADAMKKGLVGVEEARRRLRNLGYVQRDVDIIIAKALGVRSEEDGMEPEVVAEEIAAVVKNKKEARALSDPLLLAQIRLVMNQATRLVAELNARRALTDLPPLQWQSVVP